MTGLLALHGGGEFGAGDDLAIDELLRAAVAAAGGLPPRIVLVPTAAARQRPDLAVAHGTTAFGAAARRAGVELRVEAAAILERSDAERPGAATVALLECAHLVHLPGGDPDRIPAVLRGTTVWAAIRRAHGAGACVAGASAGAMALAETCWTPDGAVPGLGEVPGVAVVPHWAPGRGAAWRGALGGPAVPTLVGLEEQTLVIGRPGGPWRVAGAGRAHVVPAGALTPARSAGDGGELELP